MGGGGHLPRPHMIMDGAGDHQMMGGWAILLFLVQCGA